VLILSHIISYHEYIILQTQLDSTRFVSYFCDNVLPKLNDIEENASDQQLELLNTLAELCTHCGPLTDPEVKLERIFTCLLVSNHL